MTALTRLGRRVGVATGATLTLVGAFLLVPGLVGSASAATDGPTDSSVTVVARYCPDYSSVQANIARNGLQETFGALGADSSYPAAFPVNPATEDAHQADCAPITNWRFTLGTGSNGTGDPTNISVVTGAYGTDIVTGASTPELKTDGSTNGAKTIAGAATFQLTESQVARAQATNKLWIQGGVPSPRTGNEGQLNGQQAKYAFASLRCGTDARNADNVEWIQLAPSVKHVFCYAYYVDKQDYGTISIAKATTSDSGATLFHFGSNLAYGNDGDFSLASGASTDFVRTVATDAPYTVTEKNLPSGWTLDHVACTTTNSGASASAWSVTGSTLSITLKKNDKVACTFTNKAVDQELPAATVTIVKQVRGAAAPTAGFPFTVVQAGVGEGSPITTPLTLAPSNSLTANISVDAPVGGRGVTVTEGTLSTGWALTSAACVDDTPRDSLAAAVASSTAITVKPGEHWTCTFVNTFTEATTPTPTPTDPSTTPTDNGGELPVTGSASPLLGAAGALAILLGIGLMVATRRTGDAFVS